MPERGSADHCHLSSAHSFLTQLMRDASTRAGFFTAVQKSYTMTNLYEALEDQEKHHRVMESLVVDMHCPIQSIAPIYEGILRHLIPRVRVRDYLPIFVSKYVKSILKKSK